MQQLSLPSLAGPTASVPLLAGGNVATKVPQYSLTPLAVNSTRTSRTRRKRAQTRAGHMSHSGSGDAGGAPLYSSIKAGGSGSAAKPNGDQTLCGSGYGNGKPVYARHSQSAGSRSHSHRGARSSGGNAGASPQHRTRPRCPMIVPGMNGNTTMNAAALHGPLRARAKEIGDQVRVTHTHAPLLPTHTNSPTRPPLAPSISTRRSRWRATAESTRRLRSSTARWVWTG
jgi:hypothetical protein